MNELMNFEIKLHTQINCVGKIQIFCVSKQIICLHLYRH